MEHDHRTPTGERKHMTASNFPAALQFVLSQEGGWSDRSDDTPTNQGVTLATYRDALGQPNLTADDLRAMTDEQRDRIYLMGYWQPIRGDDLPSGVDLAVFDFAVNAGPAMAVKALQAVLSVTEDGIVGAETLGRAQAVEIMVPQTPIRKLTDARIRFYKSLGKPEFIDGWTNRANACEDAALALIAP
jgi:lysozyme family protein